MQPHHTYKPDITHYDVLISQYIDDLVKDCGNSIANAMDNSIANAMELLQTWAKPLISINYCIVTGLILGLRPANERRRYKVTPSLIGWAQTKNQPCYYKGECM